MRAYRTCMRERIRHHVTVLFASARFSASVLINAQAVCGDEDECCAYLQKHELCITNGGDFCVNHLSWTISYLSHLQSNTLCMKSETASSSAVKFFAFDRSLLSASCMQRSNIASYVACAKLILSEKHSVM